jgi:hypothetical protein
MAQYEITKCPHCGNTIDFLKLKGPKAYGTPLITCNKCNKPFIDKNIIEIAIDGIRPVDKMRIEPASFITLLMGCFSIYAGYLNITDSLNDDKSMSWLFFIIGGLFILGSLWSIIDHLINYKKNQLMLQQMKLESEKRLSNYTYALLLKQAGFNVPDKYLRQ